MVAELQEIEATAIDWPSAGSCESPSSTLRLLARIPRMGIPRMGIPRVGTPRVGDKPRPSCQETPDELSREEQAEGFGQSGPRAADRSPSREGGVRNLAACRATPAGNSAGVISRSDTLSWLCDLHAAIMPYAGFIVALALLASAGLLYWLAMGPVPNPTEPQHPIGQEIGQDMLGRYSNGSRATATIAPAWSVPRSRLVATEEVTDKLTALQQEPALGVAEVVDNRAALKIARTPKAASTEIPHVKYIPTVSVPSIPSYPETRYGSFDFAPSDAGGTEHRDRRVIASRPESIRTGPLSR